MDYLADTEPYVVNGFKQKVVDAINLAALLPMEHRLMAWEFWEEASETIRAFTVGMIAGNTGVATIISTSTTTELPFVTHSPKTSKGTGSTLSASSQKKRESKVKRVTPAKPRSSKKSPKLARSRMRKKQKQEEEEEEEDNGDNEADDLFESLFKENEQAVASISSLPGSVSENTEKDLSHLIHVPVSGIDTTQGNFDAEVTPQIILNSNDIVNLTANVPDVVQAIRNVSAEEEVHLEILPEPPVKKRKLINEAMKKDSEGKVKKTRRTKKTSNSEKVTKKKIRLAKKYLRVKRIQTEPSEEFPALKQKKKWKRKKAEPKLPPTKEEKLRAKYERLKRRQKKKILDKNFVYDRHSYSSITVELINESEVAVEDDNESYLRFLEEEERKENLAKEVTYNTDGRMRRRKKKKHEEGYDLTCKECGIKLSNLGALDAHVRTHTGERPFRCQFEGCEKSFTTKGNLKRHELYHRGVRPFQCTECGKNFTEKKTLKVHQRTHTGHKPFKCDMCDMAFTQSHSLKVHKEAVHIQKKAYLCDLCGEGFKTKPTLASHMLRHSNNKSFPCTTCDMKFFTKSELLRHYSSHSDGTPIQCPNCPKQYARLESLKMHQTEHKGDMLYECMECGEKFTKRPAFYRHRSKHKSDSKQSKTRGSKPLLGGKQNFSENDEGEENESESSTAVRILENQPKYVSILKGNNATIQSGSSSQLTKGQADHEVLSPPDQIIMAGDNFSSDELQQLHAMIQRESDKFKDLDDGEVKIILSADHASFFDESADLDLENATLDSDNATFNEQDVLVLNRLDDHQVLAIYSPQVTKSNSS